LGTDNPAEIMRLSSRSYRAFLFCNRQSSSHKTSLWSWRVLKMTFVVGISFSKFQSMNLIISVSQSSAWDVSCLVSLYETPGASRRFVNVCTRLVTSRAKRGGSNGVEQAKLVANPLVSEEELIRRPIILSDELVPKQTGLVSSSRWKIVFLSNSRNKCHDASALRLYFNFSRYVPLQEIKSEIYNRKIFIYLYICLYIRFAKLILLFYIIITFYIIIIQYSDFFRQN